MADEAKGRIQADIEEVGWHCVHIRRTEGDERSGFSYTIGLAESFGHPEIMIFGLGDRAYGVLAECVELVRNGTEFAPDEARSEVLAADYKVIFKKVRRECFDDYLGLARRFYGPRPFEALVLFWPDKQHRYPWEMSEPSVQVEALSIVSRS